MAPPHRISTRRCMVVAVAALFALVAAPATAAAALDSPLPGGKYAGKMKGDARVKVKVASDGTSEKVRARFKVGCAGVKRRFAIRSDGSFKFRKKRRGRTVLRAEGGFAELDEVTGKVKKLRGGGRRCKGGRFEAKLKDHPQIEKTTVRYGPYDIHPSEGGHGGGGGGGNIVDRIDKPCEDCFIVGMDPELVHEDGSSANHATNAMLHHTVLGNLSDRDATCTSRPERFFASGNERTEFVLPYGYGYRVEAADRWWALTHLMNMGHEMQRLAVEVELYYVPASANLKPVRPMWLDIDNCGNSEYSIPADTSDTHWDFQVTPELEGRIVAIGGHQHNDGVHIEATNETRGESICTSVAGYGTDPAYMGNIESMTGCVGDPLALIDTGNVLRLHSVYDSPHPQHDVMGIMLGYVHPEPVQ